VGRGGFGDNPDQGLDHRPLRGGRLAELMTGQQPFTDPSPYSVQRFL